MTQEEKPLIKSIVKACAIIDSVGVMNEATIKEISVHTGINISSCYHIVNTLAHCKYLAFDKKTKLYTLGAAFENLVGFYFKDALRSMAYPFMEELSAQTGESIYLVKKNNLFDFSIIAAIESKRTLKVSILETNSGSFPYARSGGKLMLSTLTGKQLDRFFAQTPLERLTENTITSREQLVQELANIRQVGYSMDRGESIAGVWGVSAPIFNAQSSIIGALSISFPEARQENLPKYLELLSACSHEVSQRMGYEANGI